MDLKMGSHVFLDVAIPVLWGTRAILEDRKDRLSVIDLGGSQAKLEILGDKPAPGVDFRPLFDGVIEILGDGAPLYTFDADRRTLRGVNLRLPECQIEKNGIRIGANTFKRNKIHGYGIGVLVTEGGLTVGAPMPPGLAKLRI